MSKAFKALGSSGIGDPQALSSAIGEALIATVAGLALCPVGLGLLIVSLVYLRKARRQAPASR